MPVTADNHPDSGVRQRSFLSQLSAKTLDSNVSNLSEKPKNSTTRGKNSLKKCIDMKSEQQKKKFFAGCVVFCFCGYYIINLHSSTTGAEQVDEIEVFDKNAIPNALDICTNSVLYFAFEYFTRLMCCGLEWISVVMDGRVQAGDSLADKEKIPGRHEDEVTSKHDFDNLAGYHEINEVGEEIYAEQTMSGLEMLRRGRRASDSAQVHTLESFLQLPTKTSGQTVREYLSSIMNEWLISDIQSKISVFSSHNKRKANVFGQLFSDEDQDRIAVESTIDLAMIRKIFGNEDRGDERSSRAILLELLQKAKLVKHSKEIERIIRIFKTEFFQKWSFHERQQKLDILENSIEGSMSVDDCEVNGILVTSEIKRLGLSDRFIFNSDDVEHFKKILQESLAAEGNPTERVIHYAGRPEFDKMRELEAFIREQIKRMLTHKVPGSNLIPDLAKSDDASQTSSLVRGIMGQPRHEDLYGITEQVYFSLVKNIAMEAVQAQSEGIVEVARQNTV